MKRACVYCGRIHDTRYVCDKKPKPYTRDTVATKARSTSRWQKTRERVRERDNNVCQCCLRNYPGTIRQYEYNGLSVHHIVKILDDSDMIYDENNLITLCAYHHEEAEAGRISKEDLREIVRQNSL